MNDNNRNLLITIIASVVILTVWQFFFMGPRIEAQREAARIEAALPRQCRIVALDERGRDLTTVQLAGQLTDWQREGGDVAFLIGGADGLDPALKARAQTLLRLSSLTLPHGMVRVLLAEQLYRAWSVTQNHPYHRA